ncbi:MAG: c-type cytochrome domain-containing protein [Pirellulales bacterium]
MSFSRQIAPVLAKHCVACHGPKKPEGDFQLHTFAGLMKTGASELPPIVAGNPGESYLLELITAEDADLRMPKEAKPLATEEIELVRRWITEGAAFDGPDGASPLESYLPKPMHPAPPKVYPRPVPVTALAFSPDGALLASGGYHELLLWNATDGSLVGRVKNIAQRTHCIAFNADGSLMAIAAGTPGRMGEVTLFNPRTGELVADLGTMGDEMFDVEFTRDGARLAACGADRTIHIYDVAMRKKLRQIEAHADWVMAIAWSPDGTKLASAGRDKAAKVIDATTGTVLVTYPGHDEQVFDVLFSTNGEQVFSAGRGRELHRWSSDGNSTSKSDVRKKEAGPLFGRMRGDVHKLALHGDHILALSADGKLSEFDPGKSDGREPALVYEGAPPQAFALALHEPTKRIAVGGYDGRVAVYEVGDVAPWRVFVAAPGFVNK